MNSFEEFMDNFKKPSTKSLAASNQTLPEIQLALGQKINGLLTLFSTSIDEQQKFSEKVSSLVEDKAFLAEFSDQIGKPLEHESEDDFVKRGSDELRQMLYTKFNIRSQIDI